MEVFGSSLKPLLSVNKLPFLTYFDKGENKEFCQVEDVVDGLKSMHPHVIS
jgi:hypothetical protein